MTKQDNNTGANTHIIEYLKYYLELAESPNFAVMLDGAWGIGKTYLIKRFLKEIYPDSKGYVYISLHGISSIDQLTYAILSHKIPLVEDKTAKMIGAFGKAAMSLTKITKDLSPSDFLTPDSSKLYVFDDLERAEIKTKEVMGFINQMVEHNDCKVILVANEKEIKEERYKDIKEKLIGKTLGPVDKEDSQIT